jgi:hypothetical protein
MNIDSFLSRLDRVKETGPSRWVACCPSHDDKSPSLSIKQAETGKLLIHCFAGCISEDVLHSVNLEWKDLYSDSRPPVLKRPPHKTTAQAFLEEDASEIVRIGKDWIRQGKLISNRDMKVYLDALRRTEDTSRLDEKLVEIIEYRIKQGIRISEVNKRECLTALERLESGDYYNG